jgi:tetratricopeptide (TPR) repeat protein
MLGTLSVGREQIRRAEHDATRALELDDRLARAHLCLANLAFLNRWDWQEARRLYRRALDLAPNDGQVCVDYALLLLAEGDFEEAMRWVRRAQYVDPLSGFNRARAATACYFAREFGPALAETTEAIRISPAFLWARLLKGLVHLAVGDCDAALPEFEAGVDLSGGAELAVSYRGCARAGCGRREEAEVDLRQLEGAAVASPYARAVLLAHLARPEPALAGLREAVEMRYPLALFIEVSPVWDPLRPHPGFGELAAAIRSTVRRDQGRGPAPRA